MCALEERINLAKKSSKSEEALLSLENERGGDQVSQSQGSQTRLCPFPLAEFGRAYFLVGTTVFLKTEFVATFKIQRIFLLNPVSLIFWKSGLHLACRSAPTPGWHCVASRPFVGAHALHSAPLDPL